MALTSSMALALPQAARAAAMAASSQPDPLHDDDVTACRLAAAVARGDADAFHDLYDRYQERLFRLVLVLSRGDEATARDVVQSAMLTAAAKLRVVQSEEHLWNWLARVARQHLLKQWRHRQREPVLVPSSELPETAAPAEPDTVLEERLDAAMQLMEPPERQLIEWFYYERLSHADMAQRLDATPKAVSRRLERARAKLRLLLKQTLSHET
jgi:RNA polymerase sigma-70 factor (ECF subfamily)